MPDPVIVLGVMFPQVRPEGIVTVRLTIPAKWFTVVTVTVVMEELPTLDGAGELAMIVKSWYWNMAVVLWTRDPLVPVRVSV